MQILSDFGKIYQTVFVARCHSRFVRDSSTPSLSELLRLIAPCLVRFSGTAETRKEASCLDRIFFKVPSSF